MKPFKASGDGFYLEATSASSRVQMEDAVAGQQVRITNDGDVMAFIEFGDSDVTATAGTSTPDTALPAGVTRTFTVASHATHMAAITDGGTARLYARRGEGW